MGLENVPITFFKSGRKIARVGTNGYVKVSITVLNLLVRVSCFQKLLGSTVVSRGIFPSPAIMTFELPAGELTGGSSIQRDPGSAIIISLERSK